MPCALVAWLCLGAPAPALAGGPPAPILLDGRWEIRSTGAAPPAPQPAPPEETEEGDEGAEPPPAARATASQAAGDWRRVRVPSVFDPDAAPELFGSTVKEYRVRFKAPRASRFHWAIHFEQVRRRATVRLNGRLLGVNVDPYTPFQMNTRGLRPGRVNVLRVTVDGRKDPRLAEGWWNWGGITRPVTLVPRGQVSLRDLGLLSDVRCAGAARRCRARILVDGLLSALPTERPRRDAKGRRLPARQARLAVRLRAPDGRITRASFRLGGSRHRRSRLDQLELRVPAPRLWSPERPQLYRARVRLLYGDRVQQVERLRIGLRSMKVKRGLLYLNNRRVQLRGASIHEDQPGRGAAVSGAWMNATVRELEEVGANVTRSHYVLSEGLLRRLDRAGIMVWNQAPVWQRDVKPNLLQFPRERARAFAQVERTVKAARNHPSVITHSVANELAFTPDSRGYTRWFLTRAARIARDLDPTLPISLDIKGRPGYPKQRTYRHFDMIGINQYFGWYPWVKDFAGLEPFLIEKRRHYPDHALVMTEFGAEGRPDMADAPPQDKGSYGFQAMHVARTLELVDRLPFMSGAVHWTLREFEIFPGWRGGALPGDGRNTRHHKGVLTYSGARKPAWGVLRDHFARIPLYR